MGAPHLMAEVQGGEHDLAVVDGEGNVAWLTKRRLVASVFRSQRRSSPSHEPERANWPSKERMTSCTKWE